GAVHLIDNNGSDPVVGTFAGLAELSTLTINGITFAITYKGGDSNDVALIKVPTTTDTVRPTVRISPPSVTAVRVGGVVRYTITYFDANFASSSLSAANIRLNRTGTANGTIVVTGTGKTRTVTIRNIRGNGTLSISILAGTAIDTAGNKALAAGPSSPFVVRPLVLVNRPR
ncbi:MAG: hypothetical protein C0467_28580, partial [Planctomycetaceae bacterium]|nr:hypothetical protein [Planctomycetaceae bacterium]